MVRPSTQQTVDRILGTAAVLSLSVVLVRRLLYSSHSSSNYRYHPPRRGRRDDTQHTNYSTATSWRWWARWVWPGGGAALQGSSSRWNDNNNETTTHHNRIELLDKRIFYEHSGSCHCGSIQFVLQGPKRLRAIDTPGKIQFPHVIIPANQFQLVCGEDHMRFYYEDTTIADDSSSITFDIITPAWGGGGGGAPPPLHQQPHLLDDTNPSSNHHHHNNNNNNNNNSHGDHTHHNASCAFCFCGNCGVHVFHADRSLGELEINAHCLDNGGYDGKAKLLFEGEEEEDDRHPASSSSSKHTTLHHGKSSGTIIETVSENEPFLGGTAITRLIHSYYDTNNSSNYNDCNENNNMQLRTKKSSMSSSDPTQPDTYSTAIMADEGDDLSMASSSIAGGGGVSLTQYHSLLSVASVGDAAAPAPASSSSASVRDRINRTGLPPRPPPSSSRISPSNRSVSTLPPWLDHGRRSGGGGYFFGTSRGGMNSCSSWSVASIESDFDGLDTQSLSSSISPRMRDQMKKYLSSHMSEKKDERKV